MQYSAEHNAVVYDLDHPQQILECLPDAMKLDARRIVVPATMHNMQVVRYLGLPVPSMIDLEYSWPRNFRNIPEPFAHQREGASLLSMHPRIFNLSDIGTGKTMMTLWAADYLMEKGTVKKALIVAPLSTLKRVWEDEIFNHLMGKRTAVILYGDRKKRRDLLDRDCDFYIINYEGIGLGCQSGARGHLGPIAQEIHDRDDINLIIIDEGSAYKNRTTERHKHTKKTIEKKPFIWVLTGTPTPNTPTDAWGIADIAGQAQISYARFFDQTMTKLGTFKYIPKPGASKLAHEILQPSFRYRREDCIDLPECMVVTRDVELSPGQAKAFKEMEKQLQITMENGVTINAVNQAVLRSKLIQISCGAIYSADHEVSHIDAAPRLKVLREVLEEAQGKVLVFAPLTSVIRMLIKELQGEYNVAMINGEVSANQRNQIFKDFQHGDELRIIVADPRTMAHGLTLTAAATVVWYGPTDQPEIYQQANGRINRPGQKQSMLIVRLAATKIEREIYRRLHEKQGLQSIILEMAKEGVQ